MVDPKLIENYVSGGTNPDQNRSESGDAVYLYLRRSLKTLTAKNSGTADQVTTLTYGTTLTGSDVASFDLLRAVIYPDSDDVDNPLGNGADGIYDRVEYKYNRLGEVKEIKDQLQTIRVLEYDK